MPTKTIASDATIRPIPNTSRYSIGYTCPKCGCDDWRKAPPAIQNKAGVGKVKYRCRECANDKAKAQNAKYYAENPHVIRAIGAKYRATKLNATPHWLTGEDLAKIKKVYEECPSGYQVDHILPLQGKHMCGLHVQSNLKPITASENASKCNREPDWTKTFQPGLHP